MIWICQIKRTLRRNALMATGLCLSLGFSIASNADVTIPRNAFLGTYSSNNAVLLSRQDNTINFDWGTGSPDPKVPADNFNVTWDGDFDFSNGTYIFSASTDDGLRVSVDGKVVIDRYFAQAATDYTASVPLTAGTHRVHVEYFEQTGFALARVSWKVDPTSTAAAIPVGAFLGRYFVNNALVLTRQDNAINFDWGSGAPDPKLPVDHFNVVWDGDFALPAGTHTFTATADDGIRVVVDGSVLIDKYIDQAATAYTAKLVFAAAGTHRIHVEYYENAGSALAKLAWTFTPPTPPAPVNLPDLVVTEVSVNPPSPKVGDHVVFTATIKNQGTLASPVATNGVGFLVNGTAVSWSANNTSSIAVGQSLTLTADGGPSNLNYFIPTAPGTYTVVANVDDVNRIPESNESNNTLGATFTVAAAPKSSAAPGAAIAGLGYVETFSDQFTSLNTIALGNTLDVGGVAKWFNNTEQCCMVDSNKLPAVNFPSSVNGVSINPYSLNPGGGLNITLSKQNNVWYSGVLTSVDRAGKGFAQQYGYFEMKAKLPPGPGTWPAFWMLPLASMTGTATLPGEIDIMEQYGHDKTHYGITLHDWRNGGQNTNIPVSQSFPTVADQTTDFHTYGFLWTAATVTFYFDAVQVWSVPTPEVMKQPYYILINNGLGGYWPTDQTPSPSVMQIQYVRAYKAP